MKFSDHLRLLTEENDPIGVIQGVQEYIKIGQEKIRNHPRFAESFKRSKRDFSFTQGQKYIKVWDMEDGKKYSIHCFIDAQTGDLLKAEGVNRPNKKPRGNVTDPEFMKQLRKTFDVHGGHLYAKRGHHR